MMVVLCLGVFFFFFFFFFVFFLCFYAVLLVPYVCYHIFSEI